MSHPINDSDSSSSASSIMAISLAAFPFADPPTPLDEVGPSASTDSPTSSDPTVVDNPSAPPLVIHNKLCPRRNSKPDPAWKGTCPLLHYF
ncbi:hypothetical protein QCA50_008950 [Cerrena zonata]|uniref:Uncharacterized protein n=1 Tax=Cerrena zonata TaxID=2478898 RepID=A0AAW0G320_9APHY